MSEHASVLLARHMPRVSVFSHCVIDYCQILHISDSYEPSVRTFGVARYNCYCSKGSDRDCDNIPRVVSNIDHDVRSRRRKLVLSPHCLCFPSVAPISEEIRKVSEAAVVGYPYDIRGQGIYASVSLVSVEPPLAELHKEIVVGCARRLGR